MVAQPSFISLVDEYNRPLLVHVIAKEQKNVNDVLKFNVFSNISLDYFESQLFQWTSLDQHPDIKLFFQLEGVAVFGCLIKPTGLKIVIGFTLEEENEDMKNEDVEEVFTKVKKIYLRVKMNPFVSSSKDDDQLVYNLGEKLADEFT